MARKNLPKFGEAVKESDTKDCVSKEVGIMEYPGEDEQDTDSRLLSLPTSTLASRLEARERDATQVDFDEQKQKETPDEPVEKQIEFKSRGGDALEATIRVSNLSKSVVEAELKELFQLYGRVSKVSLPRITNSAGIKEVRGFAYITFDSRMCAEAAMEALDGRGYDHLILKLEWAKPPKDGGGGGGGGGHGGGGHGGGGLSSGYVSGYGKALAQDTKEKAVFTSHGNSSGGSSSEKW